MAAKHHQNRTHLLAESPDALEEAMRSAVGDFKVPEAPSRGRFRAHLDLYQLPRSMFFSIEIPESRITLSEDSGFVAVNIVSAGQINTYRPTLGQIWETGDAYVVNHDNHRFDFRSDEKFKALALCFPKPFLNEYARKFGNGEAFDVDAGQQLDLNTDIGGSFARYFHFVFNELTQGGPFLQSAIATAEIEDSLLAMFLAATQVDDSSDCTSREPHMRVVKSAEEFILGHLNSAIRVADIASAVGISVPTLNRAFRKCHGVGPKAFVKRRRLEQVRRELIAADFKETTVTKLAIKYGFWHLSLFASDYQRHFGELPSQTLRRR